MNDIKKINISNRFKSWLYLNERKTLLKFLTCGSVDDGKSTLIGRLLHDTQQIHEDQLFSLKNDSKRHGTQGTKLDLALIVDGLQSEREQGITIDVAYRYFSTDKRKFIIVDTPGHEQYTRNMVTGASTCDLSIILVDAKKKLSIQTYRHSFISTLLGIKYLVVAINKMDLINYEEKQFLDIKKLFLLFSRKISQKLKIVFIPISALTGENIVFKNKNMSWYKGPTLLRFLETVEVHSTINSKNIRFPIQYVNRPNTNFRGYSGFLFSGVLHVGQKIKILPINIISRITRILLLDQDVKKVESEQSITVVLKDEIDIDRGDYFVNFDSDLHPIKEVVVDVVWMSKNFLKIGQSYNFKLSGKITRVYIQDILFKIDVNTLNKEKIDVLALNNIGRIKILFTEPMIFDDYDDNKMTGSLIFIDIFTNITVGAGMFRKNINKIDTKIDNKTNNFELDFYNLVMKYFPHWNLKRNKVM